MDLSGVYHHYPENKTFTAADGRFRVLAKGENGRYSVILWHDKEKSYSLTTLEPMTQSEIEAYIGSLAATN